MTSLHLEIYEHEKLTGGTQHPTMQFTTKYIATSTKEVRPYMSASAYLVKLVSPNRGTFKSKILSRLRGEPEPKVTVCVEHTS